MLTERYQSSLHSLGGQNKWHTDAIVCRSVTDACLGPLPINPPPLPLSPGPHLSLLLFLLSSRSLLPEYKNKFYALIHFSPYRT